MKKYVIGLFLLVFFTQNPYAQNLIHIPGLTGKVSKSDSATSFIFTTVDNSGFEPFIKKSPYSNTVQIVDAQESWPPIWYVSSPYHTYEDNVQDSIKGIKGYDLMLDAKVENGYLAYSQMSVKVKGESLVSKRIAGYILLNTKYEPVDTVVSIAPTKFYWNHLSISKSGERLIVIMSKTRLDLRHVTGVTSDSAVHSSIDIIQVVGKDGIRFSWNPVEKLGPAVFRFNEQLHCNGCSQNSEDDMDWTQLTSAIWDYDGNILYSLRSIGLGKISRKDGSLLWHIDSKDLPLVSGKDTIQWFGPQDLNLVSENDSFATYTLYSLGSSTSPATTAKGIVFKINKKTNKLALVDYIKPKIQFTANGLGSFDYDNTGNYIFYYGQYNDLNSTAKDKYEVEYTNNKGASVFYKLPENIFSYKVHKLKDWPCPPRPVITLKNDMLQVEGNWTGLVWYELEGPDLQKVKVAGTSQSIKPKAGTHYCVEAPYGIGHVVSAVYKSK